jgi:hypothetical protein
VCIEPDQPALYHKLEFHVRFGIWTDIEWGSLVNYAAKPEEHGSNELYSLCALGSGRWQFTRLLASPKNQEQVSVVKSAVVALLTSPVTFRRCTCLYHKHKTTDSQHSNSFLWSWALLEKLSVLQLLKNFPPFYGTRRFITVFTRALHWSLSWAKSIQSIPSHLRLGLPRGLFPSGFPTNILYAFLFSPIRATCHAHLIKVTTYTQ